MRNNVLLPLLAAVVSVIFPVHAQEGNAGEELTHAAAQVFAKHCYSCHNDVDREGGLNMQTHGALMEGGKNGRALIAGNSEESRMVQMVEGFLEPMMPEDDFLPDEEIEIIRRWIDDGALPWSGDLARLKIAELPEIKPYVQVEPEITSVDFHPSGDLLAAGTYQEVRLMHLESGKIVSRLTGHVDAVRAVAFSPDGELIAAA